MVISPLRVARLLVDVARNARADARKNLNTSR
jgi:hypothetical protein